MTRADLPIGTYVLVAERGSDARLPYYARVVGTDLFGSKYQVGSRYGGWGEWLFLDGGSWAFPEWVTVVTEAEATALVREHPGTGQPMAATEHPADGTQTGPSSEQDGAAA